MVFEIVDADRDGIVSPQEWDHHSYHLFLDIDTDTDGRLSRDELAHSFATLDQNGDGRIGTQEAPFLVGAADGDGDRFVSREEFDGFDWARYKVDVNADGRINAAEFRRARRQLFYESDLDRDDRLQRTELDEAAKTIIFRF